MLNKKSIILCIIIMFTTMAICNAEIKTNKDSFDGSAKLESYILLNSEPISEYPRSASLGLIKTMQLSPTGREIDFLVFVGTIMADNEIRSLTYDIQINHNPRLILNLRMGKNPRFWYNKDTQQYSATIGGSLYDEYSGIALFLSASSATVRLIATTSEGQQIRCYYEIPEYTLEEWKQIINTKRIQVLNQ